MINEYQHVDAKVEQIKDNATSILVPNNCINTALYSILVDTARSMIGYWHHNVRLSVTLCTVAKRYNFQLSTPTLRPQTPAPKISKSKIFTSEIAIVSMLHGYSR